MATLRDQSHDLNIKRQQVLDAIAGVDRNITEVKDKAIVNKNIIQSIPSILVQINGLIDIIEGLNIDQGDIDGRIAALIQEKEELRAEIARLQRPDQQDAATSPEGPEQDQGTSPMRQDDGSPSPVRRDRGTSPGRDEELDNLRDAYNACEAQIRLLRDEKEELKKFMRDIIRTTDEAYNTILQSVANIVDRLKQVGDEDLAVPELQIIMQEINKIYDRLVAVIPEAQRPNAGGGRRRKSCRKKKSRTRRRKKTRTRRRKKSITRRRKGGYRYKKRGKSSRRKKNRSRHRNSKLSNFFIL